MSQKRPFGQNPVEGPPEKVPNLQTQSNIEYSMLNQKLKDVETRCKQRGLQLTLKQKELNDTKEQMEQMRTSYEEQINHLNGLLSFQNEEITATSFREPQTPMSRNLSSARRDSTMSRNERSRISNHAPTVLTNITNNAPSEMPAKTKQVQDLMINLIVRRFSTVAVKGEGDAIPQYKIENDVSLPCNLDKHEMNERFQKMRLFRKKQPYKCNSFGGFRIPSRSEVLNPKIFESSDRFDRVSIWTALNSKPERFLYRNPKKPTMQRMQLIEKNMEYEGSYAENRNSFEKMNGPNYTVPQWFSRFYV